MTREDFYFWKLELLYEDLAEEPLNYHNSESLFPFTESDNDDDIQADCDC
jgi:hypothetical protein